MKNIVVNDNKLEVQDTCTIQDLLRIKNYSFKLLVIKVNGELIRREMYKEYIVPDLADVTILHLISGG